MSISTLFTTRFLRESLTSDPGWADLNAALEAACLTIADDDTAGQDWCEAHGYDGYTSYASLNDLEIRDPNFATLKSLLSARANSFAAALHWETGGACLVMNSFWINILNPLAAHSGHIHPHSVLSGTYYVSVPDGAGALKLEDPRLPMMMNGPAVKKDAPEDMQRFIYQRPEAGEFMMWESWLRHEVTANMGEELRISISFNFSLD